VTSTLTDRPRTAAPRDERRRRAGPVPAAPVRARRLASEQLAVAGGQLGAGLGNLVFATIAARVLAPGEFAQLAAFLALYLLIHVPAGSLSAGSALSPALAARARRRVLAVGVGVGAVLALLAVPLAGVLQLPAGLLLAAAASGPTAGLLALDRGRLYGLARLPRAVGSLLAEPLVRLTLGIALALVAGPLGAAIAVVVAGWVALAIARLDATGPVAAAPPAGAGATATVTVAFLLLAALQNLDVLLANAVLAGEEAGRFAVLSTFGGAAAFATTTVPLMLLGRRGDRRALHVAVGVAAGLGLAAVAVVAIDPGALVGAAFGERYAAVGGLAVPYLLAMALLGVARVLVAHACASGARTGVLVVLGAGAALQAALVLGAGDAGDVAHATLAATALVTAGAGVLALPRRPALADLAALARRQDVAAVAALTVAGLVVRLLSSRGIWLDEATSIWQAQMPLGELLETLRTVDVHPPLHHLVLWVTVRVAGTGELAVRLPSLLAATALVPVLYAAGRDIYDRRAGLVAAALGTVAPFAVWYAQEARMYALFMLLALLVTWLQVRIMRDGRRRDWAAYTVAAAALVATQYLGLFLIAVQQVAFLAALRHDRRGLRDWLVATAALALLLAPVLAFGQAQFAANEAAGKGFQQVPSQTGGDVAEAGGRPGPYAVLTNVVWAVLGYHGDATMTSLVALWPLLMLLVLALLGRGRSRRTLAIVLAAGVPAVALFALGQLKPFVFEVRYFIGAVPLVLLLVARAATSWSPRRLTQVAVAGIATALLAAGLADQQLNGDNPRVYDFRGALRETAERARPGDVIVYTPAYLNHVVAYYAEGVEARPLGEEPPRPERGGRVFVLASFLDKPQYRDAAAEAVRALDRRHELVDESRYPQIRVWEFER